MSDGISLGEAVLGAHVDLLPLYRDLKLAEAEVAASAARMQAMLDRHAQVTGQRMGVLGLVGTNLVSGCRPGSTRRSIRGSRRT